MRLKCGGPEVTGGGTLPSFMFMWHVHVITLGNVNRYVHVHVGNTLK